MSTANRSLIKTWIVFVAAIALAEGSLLLFADKSVQIESAQVIDLSGTKPGSVTELSKSKQWMEQVRFFSSSYFGPEAKEWTEPPAAHPAPPPVQHATMDNVAVLQVTGPTEGIAQGYKVHIQTPRRKDDVEAPVNVLVGPLLRDGNTTDFSIITSSWWSSAVTALKSVPTNSLEYGKPVSVEVAVSDNYKTAIGHDKLHFALQLQRLDPETRVASEMKDAASNSSEIQSKVIEGDLSFDNFNFARDVLVAPAGRYTALIVSGDRDLRPFVRCIRTDNGVEVGSYSEQFPFMVVAANNWASLKLRFRAYDFGQTLKYRIVSLSSDQVPTKALFLWFATHDLTNKAVEGRVLSLSEIDARARWLMSTMGVQIGDRDLEGVTDPALKDVLAHFQQLSASGANVP